MCLRTQADGIKAKFLDLSEGVKSQKTWASKLKYFLSYWKKFLRFNITMSKHKILAGHLLLRRNFKFENELASFNYNSVSIKQFTIISKNWTTV